ncbi:MAG: capsular biosynthesis protein [Pelagibacterium sp. SCN 64-44]|nr:MAG: capsular biosynthesis protein [Pelagibacterium sp. SCN 64-44]
MYSRLVNMLQAMPRRGKRAILIGFDVVALFAAAWLSYVLRLGTGFTPSANQFAMMAAAPVVAMPIFLRFGLYRAVIRYLPDRAIWTVIKAMTLATLAWMALLFLAEMSRLGTMPRTVPLLYWALGIVMVGGSRFLAKAMLWAPMHRGHKGREVAIYGAGSAGTQLAAALRQEGLQYVAGFIDDDRRLHGRDVSGVRVYGPQQIPYLIENFDIKEIIVSIPSASAPRRQQIVAEISRYPLKIRTLPSISDLAAGKYLVNQLREIDIDDLLGRSSVPADETLIEPMVRGRTILVSGAGGSIGSELTRLIAKWRPARLVLLEANEFALYQIDRQLRSLVSGLTIVPVLGSVTDELLVRRALSEHEVKVVFHAAAHKHVPLVEDNPLEGIRNNVFGTATISRLSFECGVENFVLISTDKAVRPSNVMGATKRWAELIVRYYGRLAEAEGRGAKFCAVRFGNVLGSNGSVVPLFKEQLARGGPITLTHEEMTRYFMSIHEAAELIVQAGGLSEGGDIFLLEMGEPVRIRDLAENIIHLAGLSVRSEANPQGDIAIEIIGMRPAEKLHEELFYDPDQVKRTRHSKILRAKRTEWSNLDIEAGLARLGEALATQDADQARAILFELAR